MTHVEFLRQLRDLGVGEGASLLVHSSLKRLGPVEGPGAQSGAGAVLGALSAAVGDSGTLLMPTHTWGTVNAQQPVFDVRRTPSHVGWLSEFLRLQPGVVRSLHPTHSVAGRGPRASFFIAGQLDAATPCPPESPYGRLMRNGGRILFLGVNLGCNTTLHALEEEAGLPGLFRPEPVTYAIMDEEGVVHERRHARHTDGIPRHFVDLEHILHGGGALAYGRTGRGISRLVDAARMREIVLPILRETPELVCGW